jgi:hypothetical protein
MTTLYPSTSAAQVLVPLPVRLSTTGASAPITPDYAPIGTLGDLVLQVVDSAGNSICSAALDALPAGVTYAAGPIAGLLSLTTAKYNAAGQYVVGLAYTPDADYQTAVTSFQWGGWIDDMLALVAESAADASMAKSVLINRCDIDDPAAPTELTLYATDGVTPLATRTIANADGSPVNPAQILVLGALTP